MPSKTTLALHADSARPKGCFYSPEYGRTVVVFPERTLNLPRRYAGLHIYGIEIRLDESATAASDGFFWALQPRIIGEVESYTNDAGERRHKILITAQGCGLEAANQWLDRLLAGELNGRNPNAARHVA